MDKGVKHTGKGIEVDTLEFSQRIGKYTEEAEKELKRGIISGAQHILQKSTDIVPFDRGFNGGLASTANHKDAELTAHNIEVTIGYNKEYAERLHEDMSLTISQKFAGNGPRRQKYLEEPLKSEGPKVAEILATFIKNIT